MFPPNMTLNKNRRERIVILDGEEVSFGLSEDEVYGTMPSNFKVHFSWTDNHQLQGLT
jgi:hypothetical protein